MSQSNSGAAGAAVGWGVYSLGYDIVVKYPKSQFVRIEMTMMKAFNQIYVVINRTKTNVLARLSRDQSPQKRAESWNARLYLDRAYPDDGIPAVVCDAGGKEVRKKERRGRQAFARLFRKTGAQTIDSCPKIKLECLVRCIATLPTFLSIVCWLGASSLSFAQGTSAQDARTLADFIWKIDGSTGVELAASRSDASFNFFDVGDLSYYSEVSVEQDLRRIAAAAGLAMERSPAKSSTIEIFHDAKVFSRLRDDKPAFNRLGLPNNILEDLEKQVTSDTGRCLSMTVTDEKNNIVNTIVLLSEKLDGCLVHGLLNSFGIQASDISARTLVDLCILYEGRRRGLRDRQSLTQEIPIIRQLCTTKAGEIK